MGAAFGWFARAHWHFAQNKTSEKLFVVQNDNKVLVDFFLKIWYYIFVKGKGQNPLSHVCGMMEL